VEFLLVSIEEEAFWDSSVNAQFLNNGFERVGIDLAPNRIDDIRASFAYYRGEVSTPEPSTLPFEDRRRIVVLNMLENATNASSMHISVRQILHNDVPQDSGALSAMDEALIKAAINSVQPGVALPDNDGDGDPDVTDPDDDNDNLLDDDELAIGLDPFDADTDGDGTPDAEEDLDADGFTNEAELYLILTDPLDGTSLLQPQYEYDGTNHSITFPTLTGRRYEVECTTDLIEWNVVTTIPGTDSAESIPLGPLIGTRIYRVGIQFAP